MRTAVFYIAKLERPTAQDNHCNKFTGMLITVLITNVISAERTRQPLNTVSRRYSDPAYVSIAKFREGLILFAY